VLLFRAVRELLFNVLKHAQASRARVCTVRNDGHLRVIVEDNGAGFAPDKLGASSGKIEGFGLFSIRERLHYFGGHMEIESTPGEVTRIILSLPLQSDKKMRPSRMAAPPPVKGTLPPAKTRPSSAGALN
jgi:signal transduction histidine kinase